MEIFRAISSHSTKRDLMNKFGLSSQRVDVIIEQLQSERDRRALHILADFKAGMPPAEIASVNGFRKDHFDKVLKNIGELGLLKERELGFNDGKLPVYPTISERRCSPRVHSPLLVTKVYEVAAARTACSHHGLVRKGSEDPRYKRQFGREEISFRQRQ